MESKKYYPFLDGLRCFAILWVITHHIWVNFYTVPANSPLVNTWRFKLAWTGYYGVDLFFVISGFLITGLILPSKDDKVNLTSFYVNRCFKILPSYYLLLAGVLCFYIFQNYISNNLLHDLLNHFIFIQNFTATNSPLLAHLWSIAIEEHFYLLYPIFIYLVYSKKNNNSRTVILIGCLAAGIICSNILKAFNMSSSNLYHTYFRIDALAFGCILRILEEKIYRLPNPKQMTAWACLLASVFLWCILINNPAVIAWYNFTLAYIASGLLIVSCLLGLKVLWIFELRPFIWIGRISYNLYLWHYPLIFISYLLLKDKPQWIVPFYLLATFLMGWLTTVTIERYFLSLRKLALKKMGYSPISTHNSPF